MHNMHKIKPNRRSSARGGGAVQPFPPDLVLGCGNLLFGDDGFGPAVADALARHPALPEGVRVVDAGTGARDLLFDLLLDRDRPQRIHVVDAVDAVDAANGRPGTLIRLDPAGIPADKAVDFRAHHLPSLNLLAELNAMDGVRVSVLAVAAGPLPESVSPGLSAPVAEAVPRACAWLLKDIRRERGQGPDGRRTDQ